MTEGVPAAVDGAFPELFAWLGERGVAPTGPPFIRCREVDAAGEPLELEVAVPVIAEATGDERVRADTLPAGRYATLLHVGPYRSTTAPDLTAARAELVSWRAEHGFVYGQETDRGLTLPCCVDHLSAGRESQPTARPVLRGLTRRSHGGGSPHRQRRHRPPPARGRFGGRDADRGLARSA